MDFNQNLKIEKIGSKKFIKKLMYGPEEYFIKDESAHTQIDNLEERLDRIETVIQVLNNTVNNLIINK